MLKNITLSADERLIRRAREKANEEHSTLNSEFRWWLERYVGNAQGRAAYEDLMEQLGYANAGSSFNRDELNER